MMKKFKRFLVIGGFMFISILVFYNMPVKVYADTAKPPIGTYVKDVQIGEQIEAIDSAPGYWLIAERGLLCWCNAGPTSYWDSNQSKFPIYLRADSEIPIFEALPAYSYSYGQIIQIESGSVAGWWRVRTPNGHDAWVNAGPTAYNSNGSLISTSSTPLTAYYVGSETPLQSYFTLNVNGVKQGDSNWCWAATTQCIAQYLRHSTDTQSQIVTAVKGSPVNDPATVDEDKLSLNNEGITTTVGGVIPFNTVVSNLKDWYSPIKVWIQWSGTSRCHDLVIYGYCTDATTQNISYVDPLVEDNTWNIMNYQTFVSNHTFSWAQSFYWNH